MTTILDARNALMHNLDDGTICPVCDQYARRYKRKLNSSMARGLIWLVDASTEKSWVNIHALPMIQSRRGGEFSKLVHWGLVEAKPNEDPHKKDSGWWRPTQEGIDFAMGHTNVPVYVYLYNNEVDFTSDKVGSIQDALGKEFSYEELMAPSGALQ